MAVVASKVLTPSIYPSINHLYPKLNMALVEAPILRAWVTSRAILQVGNISKKSATCTLGQWIEIARDQFLKFVDGQVREKMKQS
jgi:hypothetical protein